MKIPILFTAALALLLAAAPVSRTHAQAQDASFDLFYNSLADDGDWYNTPEYGYVWQPYIAYKSDSWRPYSDGYWAQTDDGWTWVSYEDFGWATYHYGRWTRLQDLGWAWVPGYEWGPAGFPGARTMITWVGPPCRPNASAACMKAASSAGRRAFRSITRTSRTIRTATRRQSMTSTTLGPENYSFVECRHFGAPVLSVVILPYAQNFAYFQGSVNVTNIYYQHVDNRVVVINHGPDFAYLSRYSEQPIQQLRLDRHTDVAYLQGNGHAGFNPTLVRGGVLEVASPTIARRPVNFAQIKPPRVKANLPQAQVIHGWTGVKADPQAVAEMRQKIKQQAQAVPKRQANGEIVIPSRPHPGERSEGAAAVRPGASGYSRGHRATTGSPAAKSALDRCRETGAPPAKGARARR